MDGPRYRKELRPADLNARRQRKWREALFSWRSRVLLACGVALLALLGGSRVARKPPVVMQHPEPGIPPEIVSQLAGTRLEMALAKLDQARPDEALALMVSALKADPAAADARMLAEKILRETAWHFPVLELAHPLPVERVEFAAPATLWVSLAGGMNTTVRWNLDTLRIENVLFPAPAAATRTLVIDPTRRWLVVERAGISLLCDAQSLKPVKDLGLLPDFVTPCSVIVFSGDSLLLAHPAFVSAQDHSLVWHVRDAASGEILRSSEPAGPEAPRPLTAFLDRHALRMLHADGSFMEMPISPLEPVSDMPADPAQALLHAQFSPDGSAALALIDHGPHQPPQLATLPPDAAGVAALEPAVLLERFPWSRHPGIWTGLMREAPLAPLAVDGRILVLRDGKHAPVDATSPITAVATGASQWIVGEESGRLVIHRLLPRPGSMENATAGPETADAQAIAALEMLAKALTGIHQDAKGRAFIHIDPTERLQVSKACDFAALQRLFPGLDFAPVSAALQALSLRAAPPDALRILTDRLARATPSAGEPSGPAAKLALALDSTWPEWIKECLAATPDMPPLLRKLAESRIAWLEGRKADALSGWPDVFPGLQEIRLREDWDGWEQADFSQALEKLRLCVSEELAALELPENPTPEQRQAVVQRLSDADALRSVGRARLARASLKAAQALCSIREEAEHALKLAERARMLGETPEACLRAEALALCTLGDYQKARDRWVILLSDHPAASHQPGDYAEAAYTAFEAGDSAQAMAILTTGLHRFPHDADFALRAGWISLLTGYPDRALRFLLTGRETGYAPEKLENATALLAIAAAQTGATDDAGVFYQELARLNPAWRETATIEALEWPEELKAALLQLAW
ncbi:MAG: tetratricopeptide repeat protein [Verrucomicrobiaceae bacterium]|nr:MAG: tetratricopeptide repeat protein [Verrucomicrobiaceae bacterium]